MSLSLSSLLNPSPDSESAPPPPLPRRKDSLPPIQYVQSPDQQQFPASPQVAQPAPQQQWQSWPPVTEHDAAEALTALSGGTAQPPPPPPIQTQWYGQSAPSLSYERRSNSYEQRPGSSGYNEPIQLPPPPPHSAGGRQPLSPTLDHYHVASRSPEQRRPSMISPVQAGFTLPPIQSLNQPQPERTMPPPAFHHAPASDSRVVNAPADLATDPTATSTQEQSFHSTSYAHHPLATRPSPPAQALTTESTAMEEEPNSSPMAIKEEPTHSPRASSPSESQKMDMQTSDVDAQSTKAVASLKNEHGLRTHSPLRESSVPVPSTETTTAEPSVPNPKKRPAPAKTKKGMATTTKKAPAPKKRKVEPKRSVTPSSKASRTFAFQTGSSKGTPLNSSPAPSTRSQTDDQYDEPDDDEDDDMDDGDIDPDGDVYCICRKPDNGTFMIGCDGTCDDWFHGKCVGIQERDKNLIDKYVCPNCTKEGAGKTTWKRMCRRSGCRQPARVGKTKGGKDGSKYCSEECGVMYFREMVARTRGREDTTKHRSSRRESTNLHNNRPPVDYDLGARGGVLAAGELKSLVNSSTTADDFKKLGEGVLSPPATPPDTTSPSNPHKHDSSGSGAEYSDSEAHALQEIHRQKEESRTKHQLLKDRMKFVTMVKQAASRTATEKELKPKEYCGYDSRLEWSEEQFAAWRASRAGKQAFELETLATEKNTGNANGVSDTEMSEEDASSEQQRPDVCERKKCARHLEWSKLAVDDVRFEIGDNSDRMRALEREEKEVRERAALRAKAGSLNGEGSVEVHGLGIVDSETGERIDGEVGGGGRVVETVEA